MGCDAKISCVQNNNNPNMAESLFDFRLDPVECAHCTVYTPCKSLGGYIDNFHTNIGKWQQYKL